MLFRAAADPGRVDTATSATVLENIEKCGGGGGLELSPWGAMEVLWWCGCWKENVLCGGVLQRDYALHVFLRLLEALAFYPFPLVSIAPHSSE